MPGAVAANFHEGSRSEYLAQYVFASFGTAVAVPHAEDFGLDLYCTLGERIGQRLFPTAHYTVQVKSTTDPWVFDDADEVKWFVTHPMPLFLCIVNKAALRIRIFQTCARFCAWTFPPLPPRIELLPGDGTKGERPQWSKTNVYPLTAPIIEATLVELQDAAFHAKIKSVLRFWIEREEENLNRIRHGIRAFLLPAEYTTNSTDHKAWIAEDLNDPPDEDLGLTKKSVGLIVSSMTSQLQQKGDLAGAARGALLLRHLFPDAGSLDRDTRLAQVPKVQTMLNKALGVDSYAYAGIDALGSLIDGRLNAAGVKP